MNNDEFQKRNKLIISQLEHEKEIKKITLEWFKQVSKFEYSYHFNWLGLPIIQFPQDIIAMQEIIWKVKPDYIIETGIARGGSLIFYASLLELLGGERKVIGIDVDIRPYNRVEIEKHPLFKRIIMFEGSSTDTLILQQVKEKVMKKKVLVVLDSNHTHEHVLKELQLYSPLVSKDSYLVVFDTIIEDMPDDFSINRPWGKGNNPKTAVWEFLKNNDRFEIDKEIENKNLITVAPDGYLKCIKE